MSGTQYLLPKSWKVRARSDDNLSGAKYRWHPHYQRPQIAILTVSLAALVIVLAQVAMPIIGSLGWMAAVVWAAFAVSTLLMAFWYDELIWEGRTLKPSELSPIPWRPNLYRWTRERGKESPAGTPASTTPPKPKATTQYGISFIGEVERWFTGERRDDFVIVAPILPDASVVVAGDPGKKDALGKEMAVGVGIGWNMGLQYYVPGTPHLYFLGRDGLTAGITDPYLCRMLVGLDGELRTKLYDLRPDSVWWRIVIYFEDEPMDPRRPMSAPQDLKVILENMDLRAQMDRARREAQKIAEHHEHQMKRLGR